MKTISQDALAQMLLNYKGTTLVGLTYKTEYIPGRNLYKGYEAVTKIETGVFLIGGSYAKAAKRIDPAAEIQPRTWGTHLSNSLIEHKGQFYLQFRRLKNSTRQKTYFVGGIETAYNAVKDWFYKRDNDNPYGLSFQNVRFDNILTITFGGVRYKVSDVPNVQLPEGLKTLLLQGSPIQK